MQRLRRMADYVREEGVQLLHTYHSRSSFWTRWISRWMGVPNLFEDGATHFSYGVASRALLMSNVFLCDGILCPSRTVARSYSAPERWLASRGPAVILWHFPDELGARGSGLGAPRTARTRRMLSSPTPAGYPGRTRPLISLRHHRPAAPGRPSLMIGDGPSRAKLERLGVQRVERADHVHRRAGIPPGRVPSPQSLGRLHDDLNPRLSIR